MAKDTGDKTTTSDLDVILCDPSILLGEGEVDDGISEMLRAAAVMPSQMIGKMVRTKLRSISPEAAVALCRAIAENGDQEMIGTCIKQVIVTRLA